MNFFFWKINFKKYLSKFPVLNTKSRERIHTMYILSAFYSNLKLATIHWIVAFFSRLRVTMIISHWDWYLTSILLQTKTSVLTCTIMIQSWSKCPNCSKNKIQFIQFFWRIVAWNVLRNYKTFQETTQCFNMRNFGNWSNFLESVFECICKGWDVPKGDSNNSRLILKIN